MPSQKIWPTAVQSDVLQKKSREQNEVEERIPDSSSVVAKGTQSAFLCCDWIIILLLIHVACVFPPWALSEWQRAACHAAGPDKSYESCPEEPQRRSRVESFSPNPGRCHCFRTRWPITHGTWTDEEEKQSLILSCSVPHFLPRPICLLQNGAVKNGTTNRVREPRRRAGTNCSDVSRSWC